MLGKRRRFYRNAKNKILFKLKNGLIGIDENSIERKIERFLERK